MKSAAVKYRALILADAHKPPVAHRDLSSSNVLVRADGTCALCDFGCSTTLHSFLRYHRQSHTTDMSVSRRRHNLLLFIHGTVKSETSGLLKYNEDSAQLSNMAAFVVIKDSPRINEKPAQWQHLIPKKPIHISINLQGHAQWGTLRYMSPEVLEGSVNLKNTWYLMQGDVYALALLLWEIWMRCSDLFEGKLA